MINIDSQQTLTYGEQLCGITRHYRAHLNRFHCQASSSNNNADLAQLVTCKELVQKDLGLAHPYSFTQAAMGLLLENLAMYTLGS